MSLIPDKPTSLSDYRLPPPAAGPQVPSPAVRLGVLADFREEKWAAMDRCSDELLRHLPEAAPEVSAEAITPRFRSAVQRLPILGRRRAAWNVDRLVNRFWNYPLHARRLARRFDRFHVVDHSYAQLVHELPPHRTGVYCHDLDAFRCLLEPDREPRPWWYRRMSRRILSGLKKAAFVFYSTESVGRRLAELEGLSPAKLVYAPYGVAKEFRPAPSPCLAPTISLDDSAGGLRIVHVGSCIPRKRIDVLLATFAEVRRRFPQARLIKVGGEFTAEHRDLIAAHELESAVTHLRDLSDDRLADEYRRADVVLVPSEAEGFGLPIIEALACGAPVVASDIPVMREVGGTAVTFRPVADVAAWAEAVSGVLANPDSAPSRGLRLAQAARYSWHEHARTIGETYLRSESPGALAPGALVS